jgi:hypothetical protein
MNDLYQIEDEILLNFQRKLDTNSVRHEDMVKFKEHYESLAAESQVMLKISDRLQKRLDTANTKIKEKNNEIVQKNLKLKEAIEKLAEARVGKRASTIMFTVAILLFVSEEIYLGPLIEYFVNFSYLILLFKGGIALILKTVESFLESFFTKGEQKKILTEARNEVVVA